MKDEGVIKFKCTWIAEPAMPFNKIAALDEWRNKLYEARLIGEDANGVGFGNISCRLKGNTFIITGTGTGSLKKLNAENYTCVAGYDLSKNTITCAGPIKASSESLTHAAVYESLPFVNAVFHVHHPGLWKKLLTELPSAAAKIEYGTTAMAYEIKSLMADPVVLEQGILAMGGHREGVIAFGKNPGEAGKKIASWLERL